MDGSFAKFEPRQAKVSDIVSEYPSESALRLTKGAVTMNVTSAGLLIDFGMNQLHAYKPTTSIILKLSESQIYRMKTENILQKREQLGSNIWLFSSEEFSEPFESIHIIQSELLKLPKKKKNWEPTHVTVYLGNIPLTQEG